MQINITRLIDEEVSTWHVAPVDQGQIIEVAYAVAGESELLVRRETDQSNGSVAYSVADLEDVVGQIDLINERPRVRKGAWRRVDA